MFQPKRWLAAPRLPRYVSALCVWLGLGLRAGPLSLAGPWWPGTPGWAGRRGGGGFERAQRYGGARQPAVHGRSLSGLRTAQMCLIRSPATSNANTVTVTPSCWATSPGWPLTVRSKIVRPGAQRATSRQARAICSAPSIGRSVTAPTRPPLSAITVASGSSRPMRAPMSWASQACLKARTRPACRAAGAAGAWEARMRRRAEADLRHLLRPLPAHWRRVEVHRAGLRGRVPRRQPVGGLGARLAGAPADPPPANKAVSEG